MKKLFIGLFLFLLVTACSSQIVVKEKLGSQIEQNLKTEFRKSVNINYLLYLPKDYELKDKFPLLLFLHGAGERGNDLQLVKKHGPPKLIEEGKEFPFIVVSPQCPLNKRWNTEDLIALLDYLIENYKVDKNKIYVTGLSMGGNGTWRLAAEIPDRLAAIIPICGWGDPFAVCMMGKLPVWAFHGAKDQVVPVSASEELVERLKSCGGDVKFTVYPEANHDSWTETYNNPEIYEWLLNQSLENRNK
ncbi:prolyl oligopeptidase family serine peptidase [Ignavibacteria bacterium 4148-Me]|uniref:carboxylesterase family protein n=1 Tax=Rosettibacter primus TaxID=3111523 RepID=UPI00336BC60C